MTLFKTNRYIYTTIITSMIVKLLAN